MDSDALKNYFLEKLKAPGYDGLNGVDMAIHIPLKINLLNFILRTMISTSEGMKDVHEIVFSEVDNNRFLLKVNHKLIKKKIRAQIEPIETNERGEQELTIEFLDGIKFYEKAAINTFNTFRSGWSRFKRAFKGTGPKALEGPKTFWELTGSHVKINFDALLQKQDMGYLAPALDMRDITTRDNRFIIDLRIKT